MFSLRSLFERIFGKYTWYVYHCRICGQWSKVLSRKPPIRCSAYIPDLYRYCSDLYREKLDVAQIRQCSSEPFLVHDELMKYDTGIRKIFDVDDPNNFIGFFMDAFPSRPRLARPIGGTVLGGGDVMVVKGDLVYLRLDYAGRNACPECAKEPEPEVFGESAYETFMLRGTHTVGRLMVAKEDHLTEIAFWVDCDRHSPCLVPHDVEGALIACRGGKPDDPRFDPPVRRNEELIKVLLAGKTEDKKDNEVYLYCPQCDTQVKTKAGLRLVDKYPIFQRKCSICGSVLFEPKFVVTGDIEAH